MGRCQAALKATTGPYTSMDWPDLPGLHPGQAAGILGNARRERRQSHARTKRLQSRYFGKYQWDASRARKLAGLNIDVATASEQDQTAFV